MRKTMAALVVGMMMVGSVFAAETWQTALDKAKALYASGDYVAAQAAFEKFPADFPDAPQTWIAQAQQFVAYCLCRQSKLAEAIVASDKVLADFPNSGKDRIAAAMEYKGQLLYAQGKYVEAQQQYSALVTNFANEPVVVANVMVAQKGVANCLLAQGKRAEANAAYVDVVLDNAWRMKNAAESSVVIGAFDQVNPKLMTVAAYKEFLDSAIKSTRATETNAAFLGRLKSEVEKMK